MSDYISREDVIKIIFESCADLEYKSDNEEVRNEINSIKPADVRENIHGHWKKRTYIGNHETVTMNVCSECGKEFGWDIETGISIGDNNFCPNCGADMREPKGEKGTE